MTSKKIPFPTSYGDEEILLIKKAATELSLSASAFIRHFSVRAARDILEGEVTQND